MPLLALLLDERCYLCRLHGRSRLFLLPALLLLPKPLGLGLALLGGLLPPLRLGALVLAPLRLLPLAPLLLLARSDAVRGFAPCGATAALDVRVAAVLKLVPGVQDPFDLHLHHVGGLVALVGGALEPLARLPEIGGHAVAPQVALPERELGVAVAVARCLVEPVHRQLWVHRQSFPELVDCSEAELGVGVPLGGPEPEAPSEAPVPADAEQHVAGDPVQHEAADEGLEAVPLRGRRPAHECSRDEDGEEHCPDDVRRQPQHHLPGDVLHALHQPPHESGDEDVLERRADKAPLPTPCKAVFLQFSLSLGLLELGSELQAPLRLLLQPLAEVLRVQARCRCQEVRPVLRLIPHVKSVCIKRKECLQKN
mmetsp:Transcript_12482/g.29652  ORF Transcript_12482/g.29652 Transcript_12482/m.29652 type:complete len:368 (+) Transcript_12482:1477-2580(+)